MQQPLLMSGKLEKFMEGDMDRDDIVNDAWMSQGRLDEPAIAKLDNQFFGFEKWMEAELWAQGLAEETVLQYRQQWWKEVKRREASHVAAGGRPFRYVTVEEAKAKAAKTVS